MSKQKEALIVYEEPDLKVVYPTEISEEIKDSLKPYVGCRGPCPCPPCPCK